MPWCLEQIFVFSHTQTSFCCLCVCFCNMPFFFRWTLQVYYVSIGSEHLSGGLQVRKCSPGNAASQGGRTHESLEEWHSLGTHFTPKPWLDEELAFRTWRWTKFQMFHDWKRRGCAVYRIFTIRIHSCYTLKGVMSSFEYLVQYLIFVYTRIASSVSIGDFRLPPWTPPGVDFWTKDARWKFNIYRYRMNEQFVCLTILYGIWLFPYQETPCNLPGGLSGASQPFNSLRSTPP